MHNMQLSFFKKYVNPSLKKQFYQLSKCLQCFCSSAYREKVEVLVNEEISCQNKIIYNDFLIKVKQNEIPRRNHSIFLKYITDKEVFSNKINGKTKGEKYEQGVNFPYEIKKKYLKQPVLNDAVSEIFPNSVQNFIPSDNEKLELRNWSTYKAHKINVNELENPQKWSVTDENDIPNDNIDDIIKFGSCDPNVPSSSTPCGGCGAYLHCINPSIPGFLPKEVFLGKSERELLSEICQRCHFLKEFDVALGVSVSSSEYPKIISQISNKKALVILMVDLLDFPCSIWQGINELIGAKPVILVGNKIDLFIQEEKWFLNHMKHCLLTSVKEQGVEINNVKHVALISAKTGFGVEELINKLHKHWGRQGDVYLVGCTNVGKSTLFNTLIQSDFCKVKATDLMQRATISSWPGTTLNLLKFPIKSPSGWQLYARTCRLKEQSKDKHAFDKMLKNTINVRLEQIPLSGYVGKTYKSEEEAAAVIKCNVVFLDGSPDNKKGLNPNDPEFAFGKWCYDTPGVVNSDQIVNLLTTPELLLTLPTTMVFPRNFHLKPGYSLFIGGLARLDYISGTNLVWFTVYSSTEIPITVTKLEDAEFVYDNLLGSNIFRVPFGGQDRLAKWPKLSSKKFEISGIIGSEATADVVLSSAGWVAVTLPSAFRCNVEAWTPEGRGIFLRKPPIIKTGHTFRGPRIKNTPAFKNILKEVKPPSILDNPNSRNFKVSQ